MTYSDCRKSPDKIQYASRNTAEDRAHVRSVLTGKQLYAYECLRGHGGCGWYHIASAPVSEPPKKEDDNA